MYLKTLEYLAIHVLDQSAKLNPLSFFQILQFQCMFFLICWKISIFSIRWVFFDSKCCSNSWLIRKAWFKSRPAAVIDCVRSTFENGTEDCPWTTLISPSFMFSGRRESSSFFPKRFLISSSMVFQRNFDLISFSLVGLIFTCIDWINWTPHFEVFFYLFALRQYPLMLIQSILLLQHLGLVQ